MKLIRHALLGLAHAATPGGVVPIWHRFRGCRCAQRPANGWEPFGFNASRIGNHPGGMPAISRGLSGAIPPVCTPQTPRIPEGCQLPNAGGLTPKRPN